MKHPRVILGAVASGALIACIAFAPGTARADGPQATSTAAQHAGFAAGGADLASVKRHLHHALNCLVGPEGEGFEAGTGNPCSAAGGAIPQAADAATTEKLEKTAAALRTAIASDDLEVAKKAASDAQAALK